MIAIISNYVHTCSYSIDDLVKTPIPLNKRDRFKSRIKGGARVLTSKEHIKKLKEKETAKEEKNLHK